MATKAIIINKRKGFLIDRALCDSSIHGIMSVIADKRKPDDVQSIDISRSGSGGTMLSELTVLTRSPSTRGVHYNISSTTRLYGMSTRHVYTYAVYGFMTQNYSHYCLGYSLGFHPSKYQTDRLLLLILIVENSSRNLLLERGSPSIIYLNCFWGPLGHEVVDASE